MNKNGQTLNTIVATAVPRFREISDEDAAAKPNPTKWSRKEILGHLIDSAANNHGRFVVAHLQDELVFAGYRQEEWVAIQDYQHRPWKRLVDLWECYNLHLASLLDRIPDEVLLREHQRHGLHKMAWKKVPEQSSTTLDYLIKDYLGHLEHHVRQILPDYDPVVIGTYEYPAESA